jgi:hypothetical protein
MRGRGLILLVFAAVTLLATPGPAAAWGAKAHRVVADLAARDLCPEARAQVAQLLAGEPDPTLPGVATWADELRENDAQRGKATAPWHYVNFPRDRCEYVPARDCADGNCLVAAIARQSQVLADRSRPLPERREALKFLVHFVADAHQPLHAGYGDDLGGNRHQLQFAGKGTNLHAVWDRLLVPRDAIEPHDYADWLAAQSPLPPDPARGLDRPEIAWVLESCRLVQADGFYPPVGNLAPDYLARAQPVADRRVREAARRLAVLLNATLAPATAATSKAAKP